MSKPNQIKSFLWSNWYKIAILAFFCYLFLQRDLSFQINLNAPFQNKKEVPQEKLQEIEAPSLTPAKNKSFEKISQQQQAPNVAIGYEKPYHQLGYDFSEKNLPTTHPLPSLSSVSEAKKMKYLKRFAHVAINERKKYGIPSSIILANALIQSQAGNNDVAKQANNHFAIICDTNWSGPSKQLYGSCYRNYENAWSSFRDHSLYITSEKYQDLRQLSSHDYKTWAQALAQKGFSKKPNFAQELIQIIQTYQLYELDTK